jgi:uncharacterized membrane protein YfcA
MSEVFLINLAIGIVAGVLAGMFGIGGGAVIVPALIIFSNFTLKQANGTSLAALLLPVGILAVIEYYRAGLINIRVSALVSCGLLIGVIFGSMIALDLPTQILKICYGIFLLYVSYSFMNPREMWYKLILRKDLPDNGKPDKNIRTNVPLYWFLIVGTIAGVLAGLFGIGGGLVIVPFLIKFLNFSTKKAAGTSLGALMLPVGLPGVLLYYNAGQLDIGYAIPVALGLLIGAIFGAKITIAMPSTVVKRVYAVFLLIMSINFFWGSL